jgi:hypothetical protein
MKLLRLLLTDLFAFLLKTHVRRAVALTVIVAVALTAVAPPARAQIGIGAVIIAATAVVSLITNSIGGLLNAVEGTLGSINNVLMNFEMFWEDVVYPLHLINQARAMVTAMINQYRALLTGLMQINVASAQLPNPVALETIMLDRNTGDFPQLTNAFGQTYQAIPPAANANPMERNLTDIDDALALENLKTLKASDAMVDQMMAAANAIEDEGTEMAPGSAPYLAGAGMIASVESQAMMQRMIAAAIRQEAARVAHDNTIRKRNAMFGAQFRTDVQTMFQK